MNNNITIAQATLDDLEGISPLFNEYRIFYKQASDLNACRTYLQERLTGLQSIIFVAKNLKKETLGFAQLYPSFSSVSLKKLWILNDLFVKENERGNGVGSLLLKRCRELVEITEARGVILETNHDNFGAQKLYESFGFVTDSDQVIHYYLDI